MDNDIEMQALEDECERLIAKFEQLQKRVAAQDAEISKLRATIMRLTDASEGATEL